MNLFSGDVVWAELGPSRGREQQGRQPMVVVASDDYLETVDTLAIVVLVTSRDRGWPNHIRLSGETGLAKDSFAMTEQLLTISRERIVGLAGSVDEMCLGRIAVYLRDFLVATPR